MSEMKEQIAAVDRVIKFLRDINNITTLANEVKVDISLLQDAKETLKRSRLISEGKSKIILVQGVAGDSLYLNDHRIAGPKPLGGGELIKEWIISIKDVFAALPAPPEG